ncbi:MBG domain-containing protein [Luteolibacter marinus]|uniref:MBG domain-containing protein n=1 Tax=Luteolibacter marinus TaxID=2776705 RepID=UPI00186832AD
MNNPDASTVAAITETPTPRNERAKLALLERILADSESFAGLPEERRQQLALYAGQLATEQSPRVQCWSIDTPPEVVQAFLRVEQQFARLDGASIKALRVADRWSRTAVNGSGQGVQGQPVTLTWSIVPDGTPISSTDPTESTDTSSLRARMTELYGGSATGDPRDQPWFSVFQAVFDNLADISGLQFVYEENDDGVSIDSSSGSSDWGVVGTRGDIRLSGHRIDGNSNVLAYAYYPDNGDVVIDTADSYYTNIGNTSIRLRNILEHEIGHSLGLAHVCPVNQTKLMEPFVNISFRGSQFDDIYSHQRNYGDPLEVHGALRTNDSAANATSIDLVEGQTSVWEWLSIDDNTDLDYFAFTGTRNQAVTIRIIPSDPIQPADPAVDTYLEGAQNSDGSCSAGSAFDPTIQQDLVLELIGANGSSVEAASASMPAGETEQIVAFPLPSDGIHYIRVRGGTTDRAQLYRMEVSLIEAALLPRVEVTARRLDAESNSGGNGVPDPDETVRYGITFTNEGGLVAENISIVLSGPAGATIFEGAVELGSLAPGESAEGLFTFAAAGSTGGTVSFDLQVTANGYSDVLPFELTLGSVPDAPGLDENFDDDTSLPAGWGSVTVGSGSPWVIQANNPDSPPNAIYSPAVLYQGDAILTTPAVVAGTTGGVFEFRHSYNHEAGYDGGVLEVCRNGGEWFDLMNSSATVTGGDYNGSIGKKVDSSIKNREAWTDNSYGYITTRVLLPSAWAGDSLRFRWILAHNRYVGRSGWHIDNVKYFPELPTADAFSPYVSLTASGNSLVEGDPGTAVTLWMSTPLPLVRDVTMEPDVSGSASESDLDEVISFTLPAGETSYSKIFSAVDDGIPEGRETMLLQVPPSAVGFALGTPSSVSLTIDDPQVAAVMLSDLVVTYDGSPKSATVSTQPEGLAVEMTYDGTAALPVEVGTYLVTATVTTPGFTGGTSGIFEIVSAYRAWIATFLDPDSPEASSGFDPDQDGWDNASEFAFGTLPTDASSLPRLVPEITQDTLRLMVPSPPPGIHLSAETSDALGNWTREGVVEIEGGFEVARSGNARFLRVVYELSN